MAILFCLTIGAKRGKNFEYKPYGRKISPKDPNSER